MRAIPSVSFSHLGIYVRDLERMVDFYSRFLGFVITDRGTLHLREHRRSSSSAAIRTSTIRSRW